MTLIEHPITDFETVVDDLYRDIHKAIRAELFAVTTDAGRLDPSDRDGRLVLEAHVASTVQFLVEHAEHEDTHVQPAIDATLPHVADRIAREHTALESRMLELRALAGAAVASGGRDAGVATHRLYRELAAFTSAYLAHQDYEERVVMPALEAAIGADECVAIHHTLVQSIPPAALAQSLALMLPAMNIDERAEMLGGIKAGAPEEVFTGVWSLASSVLDVTDVRPLARRLDIA